VQIGGPLPENKDPLKDFGERYPNRAGIAGVYIPQPFAKKLVPEVMPATKLTAQDNGQIGYTAEATVDFEPSNSASKCSRWMNSAGHQSSCLGYRLLRFSGMRGYLNDGMPDEATFNVAN
jgi:hypothetical protein